MGQTPSEPDHPAASFQTVPLLPHPPDPPVYGKDQCKWSCLLSAVDIRRKSVHP